MFFSREHAHIPRKLKRDETFWMPSRFLTDENEIRIKSEIAKAQAASVIDRMYYMLATNAVIAGCAYAVSTVGHGTDTLAPWWLAVLLLTLVVRGILTAAMMRRNLPNTEPEKTLSHLATGKLITGCTWAALPFIFESFDATSVDGGLYLMMLGIAAATVLMGVGNSLAPLAFAIPVHTAVIVSLMSQGLHGLMLALCVTALTLLLYRGSKQSEATFASNTRAKVQADALAESLSKANSEILDTNARLEHLAKCDPLTGLANRNAFNEALAAGIADCDTDKGNQMALLVVDLDGFKLINDTLGHSVGDSLLVYISDRMRQSIEGADVLARLGGDEFAVVYTGPDAAERARRQCESMLERSHAPIAFAEQSCIVGTSIGLAIYPDHAANAEELFICADMALYRAKDSGRGRWCEFHPDFRIAATRRHQIEQDLGAAILSGAVEAWFQPQVMLNESGIIGFEALVRWHHPQLGAIAPPDIVHAALATHQSDKLTGTIAEAACRLLKRLPEMGLPHATVSINVSPRELSVYSVVDLIDSIVKRHGVDPAMLEIEITEEALLDTDMIGDQLARIASSGYKLAVDDFGAGHSSLTYLTGLKVDRLKIDRGIAAAVTSSRQSQNIVSALVGLGQSLSIDVLVEGVETPEDAAALQELGCHTAQGYFFARPMPPERLDHWIAERPSNTQQVDFKRSANSKN
ncbi:diguanylate cyclase (GGDEF)-like protein [Neorhizobium huautlense]|uniref:Diguanylate cyclase (GGDEF)-like protein n=1 Tax=Neorhizobium huautlense TaxID=67774 RepID=A0ABT9PUD0_9HYPH|nr:EAL domain-containing protein [Neorhizobium huautlense]MDP9838080.1 diguanylate cyclase (GGDEF)-like protein [Neorhizobium huautlense]